MAVERRTLKAMQEVSPIQSALNMDWSTILHILKEGNPKPPRDLRRSEEEWKKILSPEQFRITRQHGTEAPFSGEFCHIVEEGHYHCVCCDEPLFDSSIKFESSSGWPSFTEPVNESAIAYIKDFSFGMIRVEVRCNACEAHLGHVFPDGPPPTGLRYCINSEALQLDKSKVS